MGYVDGFVLPVPKKNLDAYRRMARKAGKTWREHGALDYKECAGDDLNVKMGVPFPRQFKIKPGGGRCLRVYRLQITCTSRPRQRESDEGPPYCRHGGSEGHAVR